MEEINYMDIIFNYMDIIFNYMDIIFNIEVWKLLLPVIVVVFGWLYNERQKRHQERWEIKRKACIEALEVVDAHFSNLKWDDFVAEKQKMPDIKMARDVYNKLYLSCKNGRVLKEYKKCLGSYKDVKLNCATIVGLRNTVREELGFGNGEDFDNEEEQEFAWIVRLNKLEE